MKRTLVNQLQVGEKVKVSGSVNNFRKLGKFTFIVLRERTGMCQIIIPKSVYSQTITPESIIEVEGVVKFEPQSKYNNIELVAESVNILSPAEVVPIQINKEEENSTFHLSYLHRPIALRREKERSIFKIESEFIRLYREYLYTQGFTEIHSTKLSSAGLEGGSELFEVGFFENSMYLTQSPQFYKQMMVGVYERVFEVGKVYRAEGSNTNRHLAEYIGLEIEMGFIENVEEVMSMEESCFKYIYEKLNEVCEKELTYFGQYPLELRPIPRMTYNECIQMLKSVYNKTFERVGLNSEMEILIGEYVKSTYNSEFVFVTKYPLSERPFYAMPSIEEGCSETFELLYKGMEVTTGGQRINKYEELKSAIVNKGLNPESFTSYLMPFKHAMPPHGGLGIGTERIVKQMLNLSTIHEASLIPRSKEHFLH